VDKEAQRRSATLVGMGNQKSGSLMVANPLYNPGVSKDEKILPDKDKQEKKKSLVVFLQKRKTKKELEEKGILLPETNEVRQQARTESAKKVENLLSKRPSPEELVKKGIYKPNKKKDKLPPPKEVAPPVTATIEQGYNAIHKTINIIRQTGLDNEGIFRISGSYGQIQKVKSALISGQQLDLLVEDPHVVAGVLKSFLRELPNPAIPNEYRSLFLNIRQIAETPMCLPYVKGLVTWLSPIQFQLLQDLFSLLAEVASNVSVNKMGETNLATIFGPTIFPGSEGLAMVLETPAVNDVAVTLIKNHLAIFQEEKSNRLFSYASSAQPYKGKSKEELSFNQEDQIIVFGLKGKDLLAYNVTSESFGTVAPEYLKLTEEIKKYMQNNSS